MADAGAGRWLGRLLPAAVRAEVFEPAYRDLVIDGVTGRDGDRVGRGGWWRGGLHGLRVLLLYVDCWRVALTDPHYLLHGPARPAHPPRVERSAMFVQSMKSGVTRMVREPGFTAVAVLTLALGVVRQRTQEIATRMAVGATRGDIVRLVMRHGAGVAVIGITAGLALGALATRFVRSALFGVSPGDPATLLLATGVLGATSLLAAYLPARRAAAVDPARSLAQQ